MNADGQNDVNGLFARLGLDARSYHSFAPSPLGSQAPQALPSSVSSKAVLAGASPLVALHQHRSAAPVAEKTDLHALFERLLRAPMRQDRGAEG